MGATVGTTLDSGGTTFLPNSAWFPPSPSHLSITNSTTLSLLTHTHPFLLIFYLLPLGLSHDLLLAPLESYNPYTNLIQNLSTRPTTHYPLGLLPLPLLTTDSSESILLPTLPPNLPQFYKTPDLAKKALQESATKQGFALVTRRSNPRRIDLSCSLWLVGGHVIGLVVEDRR